MKLAKTIIIITLASLLALSAAFNIIFLSLFEIWKPSEFKKLLVLQAMQESLNQVEPEPEPTPESTPELDPKPESSKPVDQKFAYSNGVIKVKQLKQTIGLLGPGIQFEIENISTEAVCISFREIYIDGYNVDLSGIYCECLNPGKKTIKELTLWESEWEAFTTKPHEVQFVIEVYDFDSLVTLTRSEVFTITLE